MSAQEFAGMVNSGDNPWKAGRWSDSTKEQYFNMLNAEDANQRELQMWHLNNEYNTPKAQMERMVEAGINPAAAYQSVSTGNSSSVPNTHQTQTTKFHDTTDKLAKINTIMQGISSIASTIKSGVDTVAGIQNIGITHQNNWYDAMRASFWNNSDVSPQYWVSRDKNFFPKSFEIAPGLYMEAGIAQMFPEFLQGFKQAYNAPNFNLADLQRQDQHALAARQTRVDQLVQDIFEGIKSGASIQDLTSQFLQLMVYSLIKY